MRRASRSIGAGLLLAFVTSSAMALGFGHVRNATMLGRPLDFTVPLRFDAGEFVAVECVSVEVISGDNKLGAADVQVALEPSGDPSAPLLRVRTRSLIDEPIVNLVAALGCPVRLSRSFVAFIDPPLVNLAQSQPAATASAAPAPAASSPNGAPTTIESPPPPRRVAAAPAPAASSPRRVRAPRAVVRAPAQAASAAARSAAARPRVVAKAATSGGPRLRLDAPPPREARAPAAAASSVPIPPAASTIVATPAASTVALAPAAPAASGAAPSEAVASQAATSSPESERLRSLEDSLAALRAENQRTQASLAAMQSRLREAERGRATDPLVYLLAALVAGLATGLAGVLWWARRRERERAAGWAAVAQQAAAPVAGASSPPEAPVPAEPADDGPAAWRHTVEIPELDAGEAPRRAVSAEELIDLEQQAEFFVTLGQDESAVDLLLNHIATVGGISPLPYLKLLDIHRRRGDRDAYERVREQFNQRFNAYAPGFDDPAGQARSLEDDADVMARLQAAWPTPARAMGVLEPLLFRQHARDAVFDLAAYREVLFLYEIARDLAEHESRPVTVDLELPFEAFSAPVERMHSTMPIPAGTRGASRPLPVDVDLGPDLEPEAPHERSERYEGADFAFGTGPGPHGPAKPGRS